MDTKEQKTKVAEKTAATKIWDEIKNKQVNMFALPNQTVADYCSPTVIEPNKCYLIYTVTAILPALEAALGSNYKVEVAGRFLSVSYNSTTV